MQAIGPPGELRVEPMDEEVPHQKIIASHVEQQQRIPNVAVTSRDCELDQGTVAAFRFKSMIDDFGYLPCPSATRNANAILFCDTSQVESK